MKDILRFDIEKGEKKTYKIPGSEIHCRVYKDLPYCRNPEDAIQKLHVFVPEIYFEAGAIGNYTRQNAPVFLPNTAGGYMPGPAEEPGMNARTGMPNSIFAALEHGCVVVSGGVRGRTSGRKSDEFFEGGSTKCEESTGKAVGKAPAFIVDMKAIIRYVRYNKGYIPGDVERMITSGTSAGGALSALAGASGNAADYTPYLEKIGAADARDDIFAANCYCPIHNLENADAAYEWQFEEIWDYHRTKHKKVEGNVIRIPDDGNMTPEQISLSKELKQDFPDYVNRLKLTDDQGNRLNLDETGGGSFLEYVKKCLLDSAQRESKLRESEKQYRNLAVEGSSIDTLSALGIQDRELIELDWEKFRREITRMKAAPAFDALDLTSPENEEFGSDKIKARHFTKFSWKHTKTPGQMAPENLIRMLNPTEYLATADVARYWRIRHGSFDRDTSFAIPVILERLLKKHGCEVDFWLPWGLPHSGDYDLQELCAWIDEICEKQENRK